MNDLTAYDPNEIVVKSSEDIRKSNGKSLTLQDIKQILVSEDNIVLSRSEVQDRIMKYFQSLIEEVIDEETGLKTTIWSKPPTKSGLALHLGIDRTTLSAYVMVKIDIIAVLILTIQMQGELYLHRILI